MVTTAAPATRTRRPAAAVAVPVPAGPLWESFARLHPQVAPGAVAARWWRAIALVEQAAVGAPAPDGARLVLSASTPGDTYTVRLRPGVTPRQYECDCPDYSGSHKADYCKHVLAVWQTILALRLEREAHEALRLLLASDREGFLVLLQAIRQGDSSRAAAHAALLAQSFTPSV